MSVTIDNFRQAAFKGLSTTALEKYGISHFLVVRFKKSKKKQVK